MKTKKQKMLQLAAILSTVCAVSCVFLMIFVNDKFTNLTIFFAILSTTFATNASNSEVKKKEINLTKKDKLILKVSVWIAAVLVIVGIIFAFFYA